MNNEQELENEFYSLLESIDDKCHLSNYHIEIISLLLAKNYEQIKNLLNNYEQSKNICRNHRTSF